MSEVQRADHPVAHVQGYDHRRDTLALLQQNAFGAGEGVHPHGPPRADGLAYDSLIDRKDRFAGNEPAPLLVEQGVEVVVGRRVV